VEIVSDNVHKVIIIGSGPAGLTAAVYTARAQFRPLVFEGMESGGQLLSTSEVENFPGFPGGVKGPELMESFRKQALHFGAELIPRIVEKVDFLERPFSVWSDDGRLFRAHSVIIATGSSVKWLGLESEQRLRGHGVSSCATCDGFFFRNKGMVVVGGGDTAMEEALFLARIGLKITVVHRRHQFRASKIMADRVMEHPKIDVRWNSVVEEVLGDPETGVTGIRIKNMNNEMSEIVPCAAVFVAIGRKPNTDLFTGKLDVDRNGYLVTKTGSTQTSIEGVFACGEVRDNVYRQAVTSAGTGAMAAMDAERWLELCEFC
jgi:thioredoxin reductase (NADPH)